ncbi:hypothetical protein K7I13_07595 [Brucepastera parasyntrophica]|uniref:hypothetical protein n=1 Tax=Brucepastera parasyntrophica TaxID=2880008 RepID=UPI00210E5D0F|nr:hypothetical protein [Brucepastera parasyntrophica]ULQ58447.1 hypothetical protein K7I13_07595 [Brucepastera parasyntrophica]
MNRREKILGVVANITNNSIISSVTYGLVTTVPLMVAGAFAVLINNFPVPGYSDFMAGIFGPNWRNFGSFLWDGTFGIMSIAILLSISYSLSREISLTKRNNVNPVFPPWFPWPVLL